MQHESEQFLQYVFAPGSTVELRALSAAGVRAGRFSDLSAMARNGLALQSKGYADAIYYTLNSLRPEATHVGHSIINRIDTGCRTSRDKDIRRRDLYLIDVDPVRPSGVSSSVEEKAAALVVADNVQSFLTTHGWPEPLRVDSGNGYHLLYRGDGCSPSSPAWVYVLKYLARLFDTEEAHVDTTVGNAARISRLPGTWNRKGLDTPERPHRLACVISYPSRWEPVDHGTMIHTLAREGGYDQAVAHQRASEGTSIVADEASILALINEYPEMLRLAGDPQQRGDMTMFPLAECPFTGRAHRGAVGKSSIILNVDGRPGYSCFSSDCTDHTFGSMLGLLRRKTGRDSKTFPRLDVELTDDNLMAWGLDPSFVVDREEMLRASDEWRYDLQTWEGMQEANRSAPLSATDPEEWGLTFDDLRDPYYSWAINEERWIEDATVKAMFVSDACGVIDRRDAKAMAASLGKEGLILLSRELDRPPSPAEPEKVYTHIRLGGSRILSTLEVKQIAEAPAPPLGHPDHILTSGELIAICAG